MVSPTNGYETGGYRGTATIAGGSPIRRGELAGLANASGCITIAYGPDTAADYLLVDLCSETDTETDLLNHIARYLSIHRGVALVWTDMNGLEAAYAALPQGQAHFLVDADDIEAMPILAGAFRRGAMDRLHDRDREVEFGSLHRISDELAEFARTLARMAEAEPKSTVSDKPVSFRPAPLGGFQAFPTGAVHPPSPVEAKALRDLIKQRRLRDRFFASDLFADPAWDILLDLKAASLEGQKVSVSSLCIAAAVPPTTALRWIGAMTESGMLVRQQDPDDQRRVFIELSEETSAKLDDYFTLAATRPGQIV
ncbi:MAG: MarR family transcriptional regulator [Sphingomonadaceae bacterium]|nr:MarR family transcriptional regulator [Sphingomonadaceae bacterium]